MVDPLSIASAVESSVGLALQLGSAAKALNRLIARFKRSELTIMAMVEEVKTTNFAWTRIREWFKGQGNEAMNDKFLERLGKSLRCDMLVISALVHDLADVDNGTTTSSFKKRSRMAWNKRTLMDHQQHIRGQVQAMRLMLQGS
ncbi:hypothetical protein N7G274_008140 [Stereocaulon virgatum]|uniref:Uncharacterized protein n=1 Tax=Stereocaulon virgatum TaxID=373712 RepID=A0ABR4A2B5_9LECA